LTPADANSRAWTLGKGLLEQAIARKMTYAFETTLGGNTMTRLLIQAARNGIPVKVWYVGLATVDQNIARVQARAARGGHDIPEAAIRRRWNASRRNLIQLLPYIESLRLYDNSIEADPQQGHRPRPELLLHVEAGAIAAITPSEAPDWAKPIIAGAINTFGEP
jgi:predicted ABC-type ATPase